MRIETKEDLSVFFYIKDLFSTNTSIHVVDDFPTGELILPTIAVFAETIIPEPFEIGSNNRVRIRDWVVEVFAMTKAQRDEIGYRLLEALETCIPVYDYDEGFPSDVLPSNIGCLEVGNMRLQIIRILPELVNKLYYRSAVFFTATYNQL